MPYKQYKRKPPNKQEGGNTYLIVQNLEWELPDRGLRSHSTVNPKGTQDTEHEVRDGWQSELGAGCIVSSDCDCSYSAEDSLGLKPTLRIKHVDSFLQDEEGRYWITSFASHTLLHYACIHYSMQP